MNETDVVIRCAIETTIVNESEICQITHSDFNGIQQQMTRNVIKTQDEQTRKALIDLGWTPPAIKGEQA